MTEAEERRRKTSSRLIVKHFGRLVLHLLLPVLSAALVAASFPPLNLWWLIWIGLTPLVCVVILTDRKLDLIAGGLFAGAMFHLVALDWIRTCFDGRGLTGPWAFAWLATAIAAAPTWCVILLITHLLYRRLSTSAAVALSIGWVVGDLFRRVMAVLLTGMDFPWLQLAAPQTALPIMVQVIDIIGAPGMAGLVAFQNGIICDIALNRRQRTVATTLGTGALVLASIALYGAWRLCQPTPGCGPLLGLMPIESLNRSLPQDLKVPDGADLLLWPEGAIVDDNLLGDDHRAEIERLARATNVLVAVGWYRTRLQRTANLMAIADPHDGIVGIYEKAYPVPWAEVSGTAHFPLLVRRRSANESRHTIVQCAGVRIAPAICYDACFPGKYRQLNSPDLVLVASAEAMDQSLNLQQHILQMVRLRAIEFRCPIVRNVLGGHSGIVDGSGRLFAHVENVQRPTVVGPVPLDGRSSIYAITGDWILILLGIIAALVEVQRRRRMANMVSSVR